MDFIFLPLYSGFHMIIKLPVCVLTFTFTCEPLIYVLPFLHKPSLFVTLFCYTEEFSRLTANVVLQGAKQGTNGSIIYLISDKYNPLHCYIFR